MIGQAYGTVVSPTESRIDSFAVSNKLGVPFRYLDLWADGLQEEGRQYGFREPRFKNQNSRHHQTNNKMTPAARILRAPGSCCYLFFLISWIICGPAVTAPMSAGCVNTLSCCGKAVAVRHWPSRRSGRAASSVLASRRSLQCVYTLVVWMSVWPMMAVRSSSLAPAAASSVASQCRAL